MVKDEIPKGTKIPVEKIHVSKTNVRADLPFGETEEDQLLIHQVSVGKKIVEPFKIRREGNGYGVFTGRRRFLAKKAAGFTEFIVGDDLIIEDVDETEARRQSLIENLPVLRKEMDPMTRAHELNKLIEASSSQSLRVEAGRLGIPPATLSGWLQVLDLTPKMQQAVSKGLIPFSDSLELARMKLGEVTEEKLAETLETEGKEAYEKELERHAKHKLKKGLPKGKYLIIRTTFDKVYKPDVELYEKLDKLAKAKHMQIDDYVKSVLKEHVEKTS